MGAVPRVLGRGGGGLRVVRGAVASDVVARHGYGGPVWLWDLLRDIIVPRLGAR